MEMETIYARIVTQLQKYGTAQGIMGYVNEESLVRQYRKLERGKAVGVDGISKEEYGKNLKENLVRLIERMKAMIYIPKDVRRAYIPKEGSNKLRPLGIPAFEDKLVQGVMAEILEVIYEPIFKDYSYGFRPGRNCHQAIERLDKIIMNRKVNYVVDADIRGCFENIDHNKLIELMRKRIEDKVFLRYIVRFLKAGIMEGTEIYEPDKGTPQGGLISPILANIYLHYVLDEWFEEEIQKKSKGEAYLIRYADDFVACFEEEEEAKEYYEKLKARLKEYGLEMAEEKSKIIKFGKKAGNSKESFDFLGIRHINGKTRKGKYKLVHKTSRKKLKSKKKKAKQWIKENIQKPIVTIIKKLNVKIIGHNRYYGISDNIGSLKHFRNYCIWELYRALRKRGQKKPITKEKYIKILEYNEIARPKIYHSMWKVANDLC